MSGVNIGEASTVDAHSIYRSHAHTYDELVSCEDCDGHLLPAMVAVTPLEGKHVVELGAGTGRLTRLLAPHVGSIHAFDRAAPMLQVARARLAPLGLHNWSLGLADNARLPLPSDRADLAVAGWSFGHETVWSEDWQTPIEAAVREMLRVVRPRGVALIIETLGTGHTEPFDPPAALARYYAYLQERWGFQRSWIRTDYAFPSREAGERLVRFFFGDEMAHTFLTRGETRLPECTGLWWMIK